MVTEDVRGAVPSGSQGRASGKADNNSHGNQQGNALECSKCGSQDYELLDAKTGEVMCTFCRSRWIVPQLVQKSETEKYLEQQAKRPRVIMDNSTETDQNLMKMFAGMFNPLATIGSAIKRFLFAALIVVLVLIIATLLFKYVIQI